MGTIKGDNSRCKNKFDFYIKYSVVSEPKNLRYKVTISAMLDIVRWKFDSSLPETVTVSIDGSKSSEKYPNGMKNWGNNSSRVSKTMHSYTKYFAYGASAQKIKLTAKTTDIESGGYGPGKCSASGTITLDAKFNGAGILSVDYAAEDSLRATLSGLPSKVGYERVIDWYCKLGTDSTYTKLQQTIISASSKTTSFSISRASLLSSRPYNFKAVIRAGGYMIATKTTTGTTAATTLRTNLTMGNIYGTMDAALKGSIGFTRVLSWYYRKSNENNYLLSHAITIPASAGSTNYTHTFSGLLSNVSYQFKVVLKTGNTLLKEMEQAGTTIRDESLVPLPVLYEVSQKPGDKNIFIHWESPAHVNGTAYTIQYRRENLGAWVDLEPLDVFDGGSIVQVPGGNAEYAFRVKSVNGIAVGVERYSEIIMGYIYDRFEWDTGKLAGQPFLLTAVEWNRFVAWVKARLEKNGIDSRKLNLKDVVQREEITSRDYNSATAGLNELGANVPFAAPGDSITAECLNVLKDQLNVLR